MDRLLWIGHSPTIRTGLGKVSRELLPRLKHRLGVDIACVGYHFEGEPYSREKLPFQIFPMPPEGEREGFLFSLIENLSPDVVVCLGTPADFGWMDQPRRRMKCRSIFCLVVEGSNLPTYYLNSLRRFDQIVCVSEYARRELKRIFPEATSRVIPVGVDSNLFKRSPLRDELRKRANLSDRFVIGSVCQNATRECIPALIEAFAAFSRTSPTAHLYLHTEPFGPACYVLELLERYKVKERCTLTPGLTMHSFPPDEDFWQPYNLFDVTVLCSAAEGLGLPALESMACGVPVIATHFAALPEVTAGHALFVRPATIITVPGLNEDHALPSPRDLCRKLQRIGTDKRLGKRLSEHGRRLAESRSWDVCADQWQEALMQATPLRGESAHARGG